MEGGFGSRHIALSGMQTGNLVKHEVVHSLELLGPSQGVILQWLLSQVPQAFGWAIATDTGNSFDCSLWPRLTLSRWNI